MSSELYLSFLAASALLILIPGPNVGLIVSNSLLHGRLSGLFTVTGTTLGIGLQLGLVSLGMSSLLHLVADGLEIVRWVGVVYLLYSGIRLLLRKSGESSCANAPVNRNRWVVQGLFIALANPKTLLFFAAFLPQFIGPDRPVGSQLALLSGTFVAMAFVLDSGYALLASRVHRSVGGPVWQDRFNKLSGGILIAAGIGLSLARVRRGT